MRAPCKGCEERQVGCHAGCEKYLEFAAEREVIRDKQAREAQEINSVVETVRRLTKRTGRR